jgi:hypothetical protein
MKLYRGKFKTRTNYDTNKPEISVAGVWIPVEETESSVMCGDVCVEEYIISKYGEEVWKALSDESCPHKLVWCGVTSVGSQIYKCHECGEQVTR